ncbi:MAG: hypothetical protein U0457_17895 [Candidatus Sericytochromatia bacterium]
MSGIGEFNSNLIAKAYDTNKDGLVSDNLKIRKDEKTAQALGGNTDKLSVDQLSVALKTNKVMIKDGEVFAANRDLRVPVLHQDLKNANIVANNALAQTSSWKYLFLPSEPRTSDYQGPAQYSAAMMEYKMAMREYEQDVKIDRAVLVNALQNVSSTTNNPQIRTIADNAMKNMLFNNVVGFIFEERNRYIVEQDRNNLRSALSTIRDLTNFKQPTETLSGMSRELSASSQLIQKEKDLITNKSGTAIKNLEAEAIKDEKSWFFGKTRANSDRKDIETIKNLNPKADEDKLANLARSNYENSVKMLDGYSIEDARNLSRQSDAMSRELNNINQNAKSGINIIDKNSR